MIRSFLALLLLAVTAVDAADYPPPTENDYSIRNFKFSSGETLPELRIHYRTLGKAEKNAQRKTTNAVLIMHGTTGSGAQFVRPEFAGELFGPGQPLDATKFFIVVPDGIGHGKSSKPSDGLHGKFPRYGYRDMVEAEYRLLTDGLGANHARLVMGTSMGGMHSWLWGEIHPDFMDALMPLASLPTQISGRNRAWRRMITWLWGEIHPDFMDALMPLASLPTQISGRSRAWRRMITWLWGEIYPDFMDA